MSNDLKTFHVSAKHLDLTAATVHAARYGDDTLAVVLAGDEEEEVVSINLGAYGHSARLDAEQFFVKNGAEHAGLADALQRAGIAVIEDAVTFGPFDSTASLMRLNLRSVSA